MTDLLLDLWKKTSPKPKCSVCKRDFTLNSGPIIIKADFFRTKIATAKHKMCPNKKHGHLR